MKITKIVVLVLALVSFGAIVHADTFTTINPAGTDLHTFDIDFVTVGDAGNPDATGFTNLGSAGYGGVAYEYRIGLTELTVGQHWAMEYSVTGEPSPAYGTADSTMAAGSINAMRAMMYVNWLNAGCPAGGEGMINGGVYNFTSWTTLDVWPEEEQWDNGDGTKNAWRHKDAKYFIASSDELVKAAFYKGGSTDAGYWTYPTCSDTAPTAEGASNGTNSANYNNAVGHALEVGSYPNTTSPYGALDMAGNLWEMAEVVGDGSAIPYYSTLAWNCGFIHGDIWLHGAVGFVTTNYYADGGFRLAAVIPEEEPELLEGDANRDGVVSAGDYASVQSNFGATGEPGILGDANLDGVVSAGDYASVQANFGNVLATTTVPEPATMSIIGLGVVAVLRRRK